MSGASAIRDALRRETRKACSFVMMQTINSTPPLETRAIEPSTTQKEMVSCPICGRTISLSQINDHLDDCEKKKTASGAGKQPSVLAAFQQKKKRPSEEETEVINLDEDESDKEKKMEVKRPKPENSDLDAGVPKVEPAPVRKPEITPEKQKQMDKAEEARILRTQVHMPLSERLRPKTLDDYIGQKHLLGPEGIIRGFIETDQVPSMILWGPPGVGKTTIARIIASRTQHRFVELNAAHSGVSDLRKVFESSHKEQFLTKRRTIVFCDEIHRYNKAQQDYFLPFVEKGDVVLIGATTENPSFKLNSALLSRCKVFTLNQLDVKELYTIILKGLLHINKMRKLVNNKPLLTISKDGIDYCAQLAQGDSRIAITLLELMDAHFMNPKGPITADQIKPVLQKTHSLYDRLGEAHYDTISAFHKSVRGNDPDAAMWYLGLMLQGGEDPLYIARRMIRIASEDVGVADDSCLPFAIAAYEAVMKVGLPEADLALVHCAVKLARAPKSVQIYKGWKRVKSVLQEKSGQCQIPMHLRNAPTQLMKELGYAKSYKYPPDFVDGKVVQEYMPEPLHGVKFLMEGADFGNVKDPDL